MTTVTQSSQNKSLEAINFVIKGFKKLSISIKNLGLAIDDGIYAIGKVIL